MNIAFCVNKLMFIGLGVTISSLLRNCSNTKRLSLWFLCSNLSSKDKIRISDLLEVEGYKGIYHFEDFDSVKTFGSFAALHGDWTTYGRLLLPEILDEDRVLYLDADLVVEVDVLELESFNFNKLPLAAVGGGFFKYALGQKFYLEKMGIEPDLEYFNAGVVLFNLEEWRSKDLKNECLRIAALYPKELPSHDQSLLNIICMGQFAKLPAQFNCYWMANQMKPQFAKKMIMHFVGSPKPWDPFGSIIHNGHRTWKKYLHKTWTNNLNQITFLTLRRAYYLRYSYARYLQNKIFDSRKKINP